MSERKAYLGELLQNWRLLLAASLGMAVGMQIFSYITSIFAPFLIQEFGWSRSNFALIGFTMLFALPSMPIAGRLTDRFGARKMALLGAILFPLVIYAFTFLTGDFRYYFVCSAGILIFGCLTGPVTYSRLIVEKFDSARGLALTIVVGAPALLFVFAPKYITLYVTEHGWRAGYLLLAEIVLVAGLIAVALIPRDCGNAPVRAKTDPTAPKERHFGEVLSSKAFWALFLGVLLTTMFTPIHGSQFGLVIKEQGFDALGVASAMSIYALGTLIGRIGCGIALDFLPAKYVATVSMMLPAFGLAMLASPINDHRVVTVSVFLIGLTVGAEGDLFSFLVGRYLRMEVFSTALGLVYGALYIASITGVLLVSRLVAVYDSYSPFMWLTAGAVLLGSLMFLRLPDAAAAPKEGT